ncbi:Glutathione synthetase [Asimina triloba]
MGAEASSLSVCDAICFSTPILSPHRRPIPIHHFHHTTHLRLPTTKSMETSSPSIQPLRGVGQTASRDTHVDNPAETFSGARQMSPEMLQELVADALVWSSLHGLVVGDKTVQRSGMVPGVGLVHAPISLLPTPFPENRWRQACELAPIFNELVDRVSLDGKFLQDSLSRTKKVDAFTSKLLDIHSKMLEMNKEEEIRLGLHRSDYMLDAQTKELLQIELNTISSSFSGLGCLVGKLHRNLLDHYGNNLGLDPTRVPGNTAVDQFAGALAKAWKEYNNNSAVVMFVVQPEERNIGKYTIAVVYFRAGYSPNDYPSESEWNARLVIEKSCAIKCPSISYHLVGTKKIQQELAKPNVLESENNLSSGNNIYGNDVRETLVHLQKDGNEGLAAYILMQRIFPTASIAYLVRDGICHQGNAISELGIYGAYLRNKEKVIVNEQSGYLLRTKVSSSNEGGVAAGFAVLDSVYAVLDMYEMETDVLRSSFHVQCCRAIILLACTNGWWGQEVELEEGAAACKPVSPCGKEELSFVKVLLRPFAIIEF